MPSSRDGFRKGIRNFTGLSRSEKNWVTSKLIRELSLHEMGALDDFIDAMRYARAAMRGGISVFLSHSSKDKKFVRPLGEYLESHGIKVWFDEADLFAGEWLIERLADAVDESSLLLAVISENSVQSRWVQKELALAVNKEINGTGVTVIPILKEACEIPRFLADKLYLDFTTPSKRTKNRPVLVDTLMRHASRNRRLKFETD